MTVLGEGWWTIEQTMDAAQVGRRTVRNWVRLGKVEYVLTPTGAIRINPESVFHARKKPSADGEPND